MRLNAHRQSPTGRVCLLAAGQPAIKEAHLLAQLAHIKVEKYHLDNDFPPEVPQIGSDFSRAGGSRPIDRNQRLSEAVVGQAIGQFPAGNPRRRLGESRAMKSRCVIPVTPNTTTRLPHHASFLAWVIGRVRSISWRRPRGEAPHRKISGKSGHFWAIAGVSSISKSCKKKHFGITNS
jgi:hypothetical protein